MDCEICGRQAGKGKQILLDASRLLVCDECAGFGKEILEEPPKAKQFAAESLKAIPAAYANEKEFDLGFDIVPDFGARIRKAREAKGLTVKQLAIKIFERESLLHRIENHCIKPSDGIIKKLEKQLGIELKKKIVEE